MFQLISPPEAKPPMLMPAEVTRSPAISAGLGSSTTIWGARESNLSKRIQKLRWLLRLRALYPQALWAVPS